MTHEEHASSDRLIPRRDVLGALAAAMWVAPRAAGPPAQPWELFSFQADVTPPVGHPCMGGGIAAVKSVADPLEIVGIVLRGGTLDKPVVVAAVDWCEIRNDAYDRWREVIARAAGTDPRCVLLSAVHQHDAPIADLEAERILERRDCVGRVCNLAFHELVVERVARAVAKAVKGPPRRITHVGVGRAKAEQLGASRRYVKPDGTIVHDRMSASKIPLAREADEGPIDPFVTTVGFWDDDEPVAALSHYAIHPMSYYGKGEVSADFIGMARRARRKAMPGVAQIYLSGCSGDVVAGKYNDGDPARRPELAARLEDAMARAWEAARPQPFEHAGLRIETLKFSPRDDVGFTEADLNAQLADHAHPFKQCLAAMGLSWRARLAAGRPIDLPALDLGPTILVLCPGETYVAYQLLAQKLRPDKTVIAVGYGDAATGYIPTADRIAEKDSNLRDWCWVAPNAEAVLTRGLKAVLKP
ncbi:hypothetical protein [Paludisphaera rhizosphaerae]|uniref:hypothetical protein n=1 Tax=Paludisphaera rhizosphaerae TaxID=2711216 RepID=UPI0013EAAA07|nr:hypothetical protein [Paludisphaera rhizosphaerae]